MARRPRKGKELPDNIAQLVRALEFVALAQSEQGTVGQTHCRVHNRMIVANNGLYSLGAPIADEVTAAPHTLRFLAALMKCDASVGLTLQSNGTIVIKSGKFTANVLCCHPGDIPNMAPDPAVVGLLPAVRDAIAAVAPLPKENAPRVVLSSVLLRAGTAVGTTGTMLLEAFHGQDLPTMALPKAAVDKLLKIDKPWQSFGYGGNSATIYFDDGSYFRTQLYEDQWPNVDDLLSQKTACVPLPTGFWAAIDGIADFVDNGSGYVLFGENVVQSEIHPKAGATFELPSFGIDGRGIAKDFLDMMRLHMEAVDFISYDDKLYFQSPTTKARGIIMYGRPR